MESSQEPSFLSQMMMMGSRSSFHTPPAPPKSKRDCKDHSTAKFLANSMNILTQQQWQEILLRIEEAFPWTPPQTWAQVRSKVHKMQKKFNQLKQENGESGTGQCKWPWFEQCLMIWGKTAKACGTAGGMHNDVPIDSVRGAMQEPVNLEDTEKHDVPPSPDGQAPPFASNSSQVSKTPPRQRSGACKKPGVDAKPPQKSVLKKLCRGQGEKIRWSN